MARFLGEQRVKIADSPYKDSTNSDFAMLFIEMYRQIDGAHHKQWVLDQVARILMGSPIKLFLSRWDDGKEEWRFEVSKSPAYKKWVVEREYDHDYDYDEGIAP